MQLLFTVKPVRLLAIDEQSFTPQQDVQAAIAKARTFASQFTKALFDRRVVFSFSAITQHA